MYAVECTVTYGRQLKWWSMIRYSWMANEKIWCRDVCDWISQILFFTRLTQNDTSTVAVQQQDWDFNAKTLNWLFYFTYFVFYWHRLIAVQQPDWDFHTKTTQGHKWWILSCRLMHELCIEFWWHILTERNRNYTVTQLLWFDYITVITPTNNFSDSLILIIEAKYRITFLNQLCTASLHAHTLNIRTQITNK